MKTCNWCGAQLSDNSQFCANCGNALQPPNVAATPQVLQNDHPTAEPNATRSVSAKKKPGKKKLIAILCLIIFVLSLGAGVYFFAQWYFSPEQRVIRLLKSGEYEEALELVEEESLDRDDEFEDELLIRLEEIKKSFSENKLEFNSVMAELDTIEKMGIEKAQEKLPELRAYVDELNTSRTCYTTAEKFYADQAYADALKLYRQVIKSDSNYESAKTRISECTEKYRQEALAEAAKYADSNSFSNAVAVLEAALEVLPGDADIASQKLVYEKDNLEQIKSEALDEAKSYAAKKDYKNAIAVLDKYVAEYGNDPTVSVKHSEYQEAFADTILSEVDKHQEQQEYTNAIRELNEGLTVAKENTRLKNRLEAVTKAYADKVCSDADELVGQEKYDDAIAAIDRALSVLPGNSTLSQKRTEVENKMPKCLLDVCKPYETDDYEEFTRGRTFSMAGQDYTDGFNMNGWSGGYAIWNINGAYSTLEFDLGHVDDTYMGTVSVEIYLDGELYKTIKVNPENLPNHYSIDITGVKQLKIKTTPHSDSRIGMANMVVQ